MKSKDLELDIRSLKEGENEFSFSLKSDEIGMKDNFVEGAIKCDIILIRNGSTVFLQGTISFSFILECARCFEKFTLRKKEKIFSYFHPKKIDFNEHKEHLSKTDVEIEYYENDIISLRPTVYDAINLAIPLKPLCKPDCKGLCPICGTNLNIKQCNCDTHKSDPRWKPLEKLLKEKSS